MDEAYSQTNMGKQGNLKLMLHSRLRKRNAHFVYIIHDVRYAKARSSTLTARE